MTHLLDTNWQSARPAQPFHERNRRTCRSCAISLFPPLGGLFKDGFNVAFLDPSPKLKPPTHPDNEPHGRIEGAHAGQSPARSRIAAWAMGVGHDQTRKKRACLAQRWAGSERRNPLPFRAVR